MSIAYLQPSRSLYWWLVRPELLELAGQIWLCLALHFHQHMRSTQCARHSPGRLVQRFDIPPEMCYRLLTLARCQHHWHWAGPHLASLYLSLLLQLCSVARSVCDAADCCWSVLQD